ncbi:MAG TPA: phosphohydrolase [Bacteroidales bacterium]|nr:phosphohydrolase [Bacteroidales bacterium]HSA43576.1 phosphohydrolase [Bacteroidales bacterium]
MFLETQFEPDKIRTFTGRYIDPLNPDPREIDLVDIAHALSNLCRFGGHVMRFYSVAEHCIMVANMIRTPELKLCALLHDAAEAYLLDMPRPVKYRIEGYKDAEANLMKAIAGRFNIPYPFPQEVIDADNQALEWEWDNIMTAPRYDPMYPKYAKQMFIQYFNLLSE